MIHPLQCPYCDLAYDDFRTGLTYYDVYHLIFGRKYKRRHGVLGYWHALKVEAFEEHTRMCEEMQDDEATRGR